MNDMKKAKVLLIIWILLIIFSLIGIMLKVSETITIIGLIIIVFSLPLWFIAKNVSEYFYYKRKKK